MFSTSSQEYDLSNKKNFDEGRHLSQGTQSYQKPDENYLQLPSNNDTQRKSEIIGFLHPENRKSHAYADTEFDRNDGLMRFTADNNVQNTNQKEKNSPWQGLGVPVQDRNSSDEILPSKATNDKIKREAKINWKKGTFGRKSKYLKNIKPQRRYKPYKDLVRSGSSLSEEYGLKEGDTYHLEVPSQYQSIGDDIPLTDRLKMENKRSSKDDSSKTTSQDSIIGKIRRTLVSLFGGSKNSPSMEDVMKVDDAVVLSFPQSTLSTLFSSSKGTSEQKTPNNSHSLVTRGILQEYPRTAPFVQDEPSSGNLLAFRTNPHTNFRNSHSIARRSRDSESDETYEGFQFSSNEQTEDYNYDSLNYSNDKVQPKFPEFYDNEGFSGYEGDSRSNPHSFEMASQSTPILFKITTESDNKNYDLFNEPNVNFSTYKNADSVDYRSPRFVANLNDGPRKFASNKLSKTGSTTNYKSPKVLLYLSNDKPGPISHGNGISPKTEEIVQQLYKNLLALHESASLNKDINAQSSSYSPRFLKYNPQYTSPQKSATVSYKNHPSSGSYRIASGSPTHNTQSSIDRSKKILHLTSQLSLIIEDEQTRLKNIHTGADSPNHLSQASPGVIKHNQKPSYVDNTLVRKLDMRNANVKPQEEDRSSSFTLPIPVEYPQQRETFPERSPNLWGTSQEHKLGKEMYGKEETPTNFRQGSLKGVHTDKWGSLGSYSHSQRSGYKPNINEKRYQTNHRDSIKSTEMYNRRRDLSPYNKPKSDTIISKSSGDVSIKVRLPSDVHQNTFDDEVQEPLRSNAESKYKHYSSPSLKRLSKPYDNQYSYRAKHYEQSSEEDDDDGKITASDLNFEDIFAVVKHGFRTVKFYWDMIKKGWPILLDDS